MHLQVVRLICFFQIRSVVLDGTKALVDAAQALGYLSGVSDAMEEPLPSHECNLAALCDMAKEFPLAEERQEGVQPLTEGEGDTSHVDLFSRLTENTGDWASVVSLMGEEYVIPPNTTFLLSDFTRIQPLVDCEYKKKRKFKSLRTTTPKHPVCFPTKLLLMQMEGGLTSSSWIHRGKTSL